MQPLNIRVDRYWTKLLIMNDFSFQFSYLFHTLGLVIVREHLGFLEQGTFSPVVTLNNSVKNQWHHQWWQSWWGVKVFKMRQILRVCLSMFRISMIVLKMSEVVWRANRRKSLSSWKPTIQVLESGASKPVVPITRWTSERYPTRAVNTWPEPKSTRPRTGKETRLVLTCTVFKQAI